MSLLETTLGSDWGQLPPVIRRHYRLAPEAESHLVGTLNIAYPNYLKRLIYLIHLCGGLVAKRGTAIPTRVDKRQLADPNTSLCWQQTLNDPDGQRDTFTSRMFYSRPHTLIETIRLGFGLRLTVGIDREKLVYGSNDHERPVSDRQFNLDFMIRHPLIGFTYHLLLPGPIRL